MIKRPGSLFIMAAFFLLTMPSCQTYYFRSNYSNAVSLLHATTGNYIERPYLKAHMKDGSVYILKDTWHIDSAVRMVTGTGTLYNFNRVMLMQGDFSVPVDSVAIFETNSRIPHPEAGRIAALTILTGVEVILGIICVTVPKACWGSCPTFYLDEHSNIHYADAEAFTNAIAPSMEYTDADALGNHFIAGDEFSITMKNEALETHCVDNIALLAFPTSAGEQVFQTPAGKFLLCGEPVAVSQASGAEGDITALLNSADKNERFSLADRNNLNSRETVYLTFQNNAGFLNPGLVLHYRQTLMNTYLFYNALGYMGDQAGDVFAMMETRENIRNNFDAVSKALGNIDVYTWNERIGDWVLEDCFSETGPIAINRQLIRLRHLQPGSEVKLKLVMNKGLWRIDYAALAEIKSDIEPVTIKPGSILNKGNPDAEALKLLEEPGKYLVSMPGAEYRFTFTLPEGNRSYELFLSARGYYLEWMREDWLKDENLLKLKQMLYNPQQYLKNEAGNYKRYESDMEELFWNSRIDTKSFTYHEN